MLLLTMLLFGTGATHTLVKIREHNTLLEQRTYEVPWSLMQLQLEMGRFLDTVRLLHAGGIRHDELLLRYDILWSRTPVLLSSQLKDTLSERPDLWRLIQQIEARVRGLEPLVQRLEPGSPAYQQILAELSPYQEPLSRTVTATMHNNVLFYAEYDQAYRLLGKRLYVQIVGLFITAGILLLLLLRELLRYRIQQFRDPLTGLPNRYALQRRLIPVIERGTPFSLTVLELKEFTRLHHRFGFEIADRLLQAFSQRLQQSLLQHEFIAQFGGEGIVVVAEGVVELEEVRAQLSRFRQVLAPKESIDAHDFYMEPVIGLVLYPVDADNLVDLLARGELALELCKRDRLPYVIFDPSLLKEMSRKQRLASDLPAALESGSLSVRFQPLVSLQSGSCHGLQALLHWRHPGFGVISAAELMRVTEQFQLSERVFRWLLHASCRQLKGWHEYGERQLFVSLNLPASLFRPGLDEEVAGVLREYGLRPDVLVLDIGEPLAAKESYDFFAIMSSLQRNGVRMALSDFGNGGAAWGTLLRLPVNWLKLDATFCNGIEQQGAAREQLATLFALGRILQRPLICCGIDSHGQLAALAGMDKDALVQGDYIGRPLSDLDVPAWLNKNRQLPLSPEGREDVMTSA
ncbi:GGDEF-domain containing protein [Zobellella endophytica]|uniref:GGDEF-domain containing protein n=2 Tax=Zobellella endophytica TaxID=2116700 RepID=A0A2P7R1R8_9GAMM|nr:GGDEF-domain containing protein [Zobellella endophytica]